MMKKLLVATLFGSLAMTTAQASVSDDAAIMATDLTANEMSQINGMGGYPVFVTNGSTYLFQWDQHGGTHTHGGWVGSGYWTVHYVNTGVQVQMQCNGKVAYFSMPNGNRYHYC